MTANIPTWRDRRQWHRQGALGRNKLLMQGNIQGVRDLKPCPSPTVITWSRRWQASPTAGFFPDPQQSLIRCWCSPGMYQALRGGKKPPIPTAPPPPPARAILPVLHPSEGCEGMPQAQTSHPLHGGPTGPSTGTLLRLPVLAASAHSRARFLADTSWGAQGGEGNSHACCSLGRATGSSLQRGQKMGPLPCCQQLGLGLQVETHCKLP